MSWVTWKCYCSSLSDSLGLETRMRNEIESFQLLHFLSGVESKFATGIGRIEWLEKEKLWRVMGLDGRNHGQFEGVVASDKNIVSSRYTNVTGRPPPLGTIGFPVNSQIV